MNKLIKKLIFVLLMSCTLSFALAQQRTVTGTVKDEQGTTISGVSFTVKGSASGGTTKEDGSFSVNVDGNRAILEFSAVGFQTKEIAVLDKTVLEVTLGRSANQLEEVVVTGFGESRAKRNLGYSVTQVNGDDIRRANVVNPIAALQGLVPGLQVNPGIGGPQASTRFLIRGSASLNPYGNVPLVVIDDIVMDDNVILQNRGGDQDFGNILKDLNPDDIETVSVLKGGAVTALYGSRAANGVILIKTKKGFSQKGLGVSLTQNVLFDHAYRTLDFQNRFGTGLNVDDWIKGPNGELQYNPDSYGISYGPEIQGQMFRDISGQLVKNKAADILSLYQTGVTSNTNLAVNGGNEKTTFRGSYSRLSSKGITPNNELDRNSYTIRATHRLAQRVLLDANVTYARSNTLNPAMQNGNSLIYNFAYVLPRNYDVDYWRNNYISPKGGLSRVESGTIDVANNALWLIHQNKYTQLEDNFRGGLNLRADITDWLRLDATASVNDLQMNYEVKKRGQGEGFSGGGYETRMSKVSQNRYRGALNFTKKINSFDFLLQTGAEVSTSRAKSQYAYTDGFRLPDYFRLSNSAKPAIVSEGTPDKYQTSSGFFQASMYYRNFLTLNLYGRNDWNSTLVYNDKHGSYSYFYPGADAAFILTDAFKLPKLFDFAKLRLSYVEAGGGTNPYTANTGAYVPAGAYSDAYGNAITRYRFDANTLPNQNLVPIRNQKIEAGIEFKMFSNRLGADITVYQQDSKNQIISFGVPVESGVNAALINGGTVRNKGVEIQLYGTPIKLNKFSWDAMFNYTLNRNTIKSLPFGLKSVSLDGGDGIRSVAYLNGDYGTIVAQYAMASYQATDAGGKNISSPLNGMPVVSINTSGITGEPMILYRRASNYNPSVGGNSEPVVGSILPKFLGSLRNTFNYGKFALSFFLDGKFGGDVYSTSMFYGTQSGNIATSLFGRTTDLGGLDYKDSKGNLRHDGILHDGVFRPGSIVGAGQSPDGKEHDVSGMTVADAYAKGYVKPTGAADYYLYQYGWGNGIRTFGMVKSSWVSLREVSVSYDVPQAVVSKLRLNNLRASLIARNVGFLYNSAPNHINPDNLNTTSSGGFQESGGVPYVRSYGFSLNTSF
ncbi:MAG: SusC/RagA family TonB-linked outer membrane protein [Niabella sp.]|nr:SusC/RagA family TonB-linked outer membrane protein [Niabella sp.]